MLKSKFELDQTFVCFFALQKGLLKIEKERLIKN